MRKGTFIINPYVRPYYPDENGKPNPSYKTMYLCKSGSNAKCLDYRGEIVLYPYSDIITWKTQGACAVEHILQYYFGIRNDKWESEVHNG